MLWAEAQRQGWERAKDKQVVVDGASWVWNVAQDHFYDARQVVDWYHAMEHLSAIAALLYGESTSAAKRWYRPAQTALDQSHAGRITLQLNQAATGYPEDAGDELRREAGYLHRHKRRMQYMEMREDEYVIGSGTSP